MQRSAHIPHPGVRTPEQIAADNGIDLGYELTEGFAAGFTRHKAKQIARRAGFSASDIDDIQQQFVERLLANLGAFDRAQGHFNVFVKTVVERYAANILRDARAEKRNHRETCSLSVVVDETEFGPVELCEWCDAILLATREHGAAKGEKSGGQRILRCVGAPACVAKNRYGLPETLPLSWPALMNGLASSPENQQAL